MKAKNPILIWSLAVPALLVLQVLTERALADAPRVTDFETSRALEILDVSEAPAADGTDFYLYVTNSSAQPLPLYVRVDWPKSASSVREGEPWHRVAIPAGAAKWIEVVSPVTAADYMLEVSFGHVFSPPPPSIPGASD